MDEYTLTVAGQLGHEPPQELRSSGDLKSSDPGLAYINSKPSPIPTLLKHKVVKISCGHQHALAVTGKNTVA